VSVHCTVLFQLLPPSHYNIPHSAWCAIATPIKPLIIFCPFCLCCNSGVHQIASEYGVHIGHGSAVEAIIDQLWSHLKKKNPTMYLFLCSFSVVGVGVVVTLTMVKDLERVAMVGKPETMWSLLTTTMFIFTVHYKTFMMGVFWVVKQKHNLVGHEV
jgi:hypothetical protein